MSLINKMLQDLDARGTPAAESFPSQIRPVASTRAGWAERVDGRAVRIGAACAAAACAAGALCWFGWAHYQKTRIAAKPAAVAAAPVRARPAPVATAPASGMNSTITMGPATAPAPAPAPAAAAPAPSAPRESVADRFDAPAEKDTPAMPVPKLRAQEMARLAGQAGPAQRPKSVAGFEPDSDEARAARQAIMAELQARMKVVAPKPATPAHASRREAKLRKLAEERERKAAHRASAGADAEASASSASSAPTSKGKRGAQGVQESAPQRAEGEYRHALNALQDGRMTETIAALEQTLRLDPGHDAARQTLVGLLIEAKRTDDAIRHLQAGLALDARQPSLAMLLARLQIERGGSGIDTLTRTLPYAGNNADYHAFLAGALQREQRHREAAEQYQAALRGAPGNGVWWMGLGMSLQAEKRNGEALEAFQRARASGTLSGELLAFVERRLQQLAR
jgi:MSHA biogenesis protein MshN